MKIFAFKMVGIVYKSLLNVCRKREYPVDTTFRKRDSFISIKVIENMIAQCLKAGGHQAF